MQSLAYVPQVSVHPHDECHNAIDPAPPSAQAPPKVTVKLDLLGIPDNENFTKYLE
jgi:hypothetical protein